MLSAVNWAEPLIIILGIYTYIPIGKPAQPPFFLQALGRFGPFSEKGLAELHFMEGLDWTFKPSPARVLKKAQLGP